MITSVRPFFRSRWEAAVAGAFLLLYIFLAVSATTRESNTFDEAEHLTNGYLYWNHPEIKFWSNGGIFAPAWAALPLSFDHLSATQVKDGPARPMSYWEQSFRFFYLSGNDPDAMLLKGRFMISMLGAALGALVFFWSRELFGERAGLISLWLYIFCPNMLVNGALVTADMAATLGFVATVYGFWKLTREVSAFRLLFSVLSLGLLVLSKMSALLVLPIFFLILIVRLTSPHPIDLRLGIRKMIAGRWPQIGTWGALLFVHLVGVIGLLWLAYDFPYLDDGQAAIRRQLLAAPDFSWTNGQDIKASAVEALSRSHLLPTSYVEGLSNILNTSLGGFLCGSYNATGSCWFYPFAFLVKTPISTLVLLIFAGIAYAQWKPATGKKKKSQAQPLPRPALYDLAPLLILGGVYALACVTSSFNIGIRHMMPVYPVLFILAGANIYWLRLPRPRFRIGLGILLLGVMIESCSIYPHYMAFFNQFVGGPRYGYRYLVDSSVDWGQDLPGLRQWLDKNVPEGAPDKVYLSYFGTADPDYYGIKAKPLPDRFGVKSFDTFPLQGGLYCISATGLQGSAWNFNEENLYQQVRLELSRWDASAGNPTARQALLREKGQPYWNSYLQANAVLQFDRLCAFLRQREPDDEVGYSILIYRVSDDALQQALYGPPPTAPVL